MTRISYGPDIRLESTTSSDHHMLAKLTAAMSYLGVLCFIPILFSHGDPFIRFHSRQGLVIFLWGVATLILMPLPIGPALLNFSTAGVLMFSLLGLMSVTIGRAWRLPLVYELAAKL